MRFSFAFPLFLASLSTQSANAFVVGRWGSPSSVVLRSTLESSETVVAAEQDVVTKVEPQVQRRLELDPRPQSTEIVPLTAAEINARLSMQIEKLQAKDRTSTQLSKEDIKVVYEDEDIIVVDKPAGVLSVPSKIVNPSLAQAVFDAVGCEMGRMDMMVVHRLGMDTSGLMVFAKTMDALRGMNEVFRTRCIERKYEALVCGHVEKDSGIINLPLMRDYEFPPFMRVSTEDHQRALLDLEPEDLTMKKILDLPKESVTLYDVVAREEWNGQPVTRVALTSMSGRTHQLNVHLAAFGHPIVGDSTYGIDGDAASNGGLSDAELTSFGLNENRASDELQRKIAEAAKGKTSCVHAKSLKFRHPVSKEEIAFIVDSPF